MRDLTTLDATSTAALSLHSTSCRARGCIAWWPSRHLQAPCDELGARSFERAPSARRRELAPAVKPLLIDFWVIPSCLAAPPPICLLLCNERPLVVEVTPDAYHILRIAVLNSVLHTTTFSQICSPLQEDRRTLLNAVVHWPFILTRNLE